MKLFQCICALSFPLGVMGESAEQQSNAHPMGQLDDDRLKEPQRFEKRRHKEEETPNDFVIDLTEGDDYDASTTVRCLLDCYIA